jgi:hypothetical protein
MAKRKNPPILATTAEKLRFTRWLARTVDTLFDEMDIPAPIGIAAALMVATDTAMRMDGEIKQGVIGTLELLLEQLREPARVVAPEPTQKM